MSDTKLRAYEDPENEGNGKAYHTGVPCIESDCNNPAGTYWGPYCCFKCNVKRMKKVRASLKDMLDELK